MEIIYLLILAVIAWMEFSEKINTNTFMQKIGLGLIAIGALVSLHTENPLMYYGVLIYLIGSALTSQSRSKRVTDHL